MEIGSRIYFDVLSGGVILNTGDRTGDLIITDIGYDATTYKVLSERNRETFDYIELEYGQYAQDFIECNGYKVNPETKAIEFSYPVPGQPKMPSVHQKPLSESVSENTDYLLDVDFRLIMMELGMKSTKK